MLARCYHLSVHAHAKQCQACIAELQLYTGDIGRQEDGRPLVERYFDSSCTPGVYVNYLAPELPPGGSHQVQPYAPNPASTLEHAWHADEQYTDEQPSLQNPAQAPRRGSPRQEQPTTAQHSAPPNTQTAQTLAPPRRQNRSRSPRLAGVQTPGMALNPSEGQSAAQATSTQTRGQPERRASQQAQLEGRNHPQEPVEEEVVAQEQLALQMPQQTVSPAPGHTSTSFPSTIASRDFARTLASLMQSVAPGQLQAGVTPQVHSTPQPLPVLQAATGAKTGVQAQAHSSPQPLASLQAVAPTRTGVQAQAPGTFQPPELAQAVTPARTAVSAQALSSSQAPTSAQAVAPVQTHVRPQAFDTPQSAPSAHAVIPVQTQLRALSIQVLNTPQLPTLPQSMTSTQLGVSPQLPHGSDLPISQSPAELSKGPQQLSASRQVSEPPGSTDGHELMLVSSSLLTSSFCKFIELGYWLFRVVSRALS